MNKPLLIKKSYIATILYAVENGIDYKARQFNKWVEKKTKHLNS